MTVRKTPKFSWADVPVTEQQAIIAEIGGDGHTIWDADKLKEAGLNAAAIDQFTKVERSDGSWKGSIFTDNGLVAEIRGVYGLTLIRSLATYYDITSHAFGRGTEARQLTEGLNARFQQMADAHARRMADLAYEDDWEGPQAPEYSETDDEARDEMERGR